MSAAVNSYGRTHAEYASYTARKVEDINAADCAPAGFCENCGWTPAPQMHDAHRCTGNGCDCESAPDARTREQLLLDAARAERAAASCHPFFASTYLTAASRDREAAAEMVERG